MKKRLAPRGTRHTFFKRLDTSAREQSSQKPLASTRDVRTRFGTEHPQNLLEFAQGRTRHLNATNGGRKRREVRIECTVKFGRHVTPLLFVSNHILSVIPIPATTRSSGLLLQFP